jgi:hypothetical protein
MKTGNTVIFFITAERLNTCFAAIDERLIGEAVTIIDPMPQPEWGNNMVFTTRELIVPIDWDTIISPYLADVPYVSIPDVFTENQTDMFQSFVCTLDQLIVSCAYLVVACGCMACDGTHGRNKACISVGGAGVLPKHALSARIKMYTSSSAAIYPTVESVSFAKLFVADDIINNTQLSVSAHVLRQHIQTATDHAQNDSIQFNVYGWYRVSKCNDGRSIATKFHISRISLADRDVLVTPRLSAQDGMCMDKPYPLYVNSVSSMPSKSGPYSLLPPYPIENVSTGCQTDNIAGNITASPTVLISGTVTHALDDMNGVVNADLRAPVTPAASVGSDLLASTDFGVVLSDVLRINAEIDAEFERTRVDVDTNAWDAMIDRWSKDEKKKSRSGAEDEKKKSRSGAGASTDESLETVYEYHDDTGRRRSMSTILDDSDGGNFMATLLDDTDQAELELSEAMDIDGIKNMPLQRNVTDNVVCEPSIGYLAENTCVDEGGRDSSPDVFDDNRPYRSPTALRPIHTQGTIWSRGIGRELSRTCTTRYAPETQPPIDDDSLLPVDTTVIPPSDSTVIAASGIPNAVPNVANNLRTADRTDGMRFIIRGRHMVGYHPNRSRIDSYDVRPEFNLNDGDEVNIDLARDIIYGRVPTIPSVASNIHPVMDRGSVGNNSNGSNVHTAIDGGNVYGSSQNPIDVNDSSPTIFGQTGIGNRGNLATARTPGRRVLVQTGIGNRGNLVRAIRRPVGRPRGSRSRGGSRQRGSRGANRRGRGTSRGRQQRGRPTTVLRRGQQIINPNGQLVLPPRQQTMHGNGQDN